MLVLLEATTSERDALKQQAGDLKQQITSLDTDLKNTSEELQQSSTHLAELKETYENVSKHGVVAAPRPPYPSTYLDYALFRLWQLRLDSDASRRTILNLNKSVSVLSAATA